MIEKRGQFHCIRVSFPQARSLVSQAVPRGPPIWIQIFDYPPDLGCEIRGKTRFSQYLGSEKIIQLRFSYRSVVIWDFFQYRNLQKNTKIPQLFLGKLGFVFVFVNSEDPAPLGFFQLRNKTPVLSTNSVTPALAMYHLVRVVASTARRTTRRNFAGQSSTTSQGELSRLLKKM